MFNLVFSEIKVSLKIFVLSIIIATGIFSVAIIFYNLTSYIMPAILNQYDAQLENGLEVCINNTDNLNEKTIKQLENYDAYDINIYCGTSTNLRKSSAVLDNYETLDGTQVDCYWYGQDTTQYNPEIAKVTDEKFNYSNNAIILCATNDDYKKYSDCKNVDIVLKNGDSIGSFKIIGVEKLETSKLDIDESEIEEELETHIYIPVITTSEKLKSKGIYLSLSVSCRIPKASNYINFKNGMAQYGLHVKSSMEELIGILDMLKILFLILTIIFIILGVLSITNILDIQLSIREKFVVMQKVLGSTNIRIMSIYVMILEIQIVFSALLSCLIGCIFTNRIIGITYSFFALENSSAINYILIALSIFIIANISMIPFIFMLRSKLNRTDVASVINNKD